MKTISNSTWKQGLQKVPSNLNEIDTRSHTVLADIGTKTHALIDTHLNAASPHTGHSLTSHTHVGIYEPLLGFTPENASNKGAVSGYAPVDASQKVPTVNLGGAGADSSKFLRGDQIWVAPTATVTIKQTEIDFGTTPVHEASFVITDADVSPASHLIGNLAYEAPTEKNLDELEFDGLDLKFAPGSGQFTLLAIALDNAYVADKFKINYLIG